MQAVLTGKAHNVQITTLTATYASAPIYVGDTVRVGLQVTSWMPAPVEMQASNTEEGTYLKVVNNSCVTAFGWGDGNFAMSLPTGWEPFKFIKICSTSNGAVLDQTAASVIVTCKG
jgi:hypothetical protein